MTHLDIATILLGRWHLLDSTSLSYSAAQRRNAWALRKTSAAHRVARRQQWATSGEL